MPFTNDPPNAPLCQGIPEDHLLRALRADAPAERQRYAEAGLAFPAGELDPETQVLLLRQIYTSHLERHQFRAAVDICEAMLRVGPLKDIAFHDRARAQQALGQMNDALGSQRLACRNAPSDRRSFMLWSLATLQHFLGEIDEALITLDKGLLVASKDRLLLKAHIAYISIEDGELVEGLAGLRKELAAAKCGEGYGQFLLGMIAYHISDYRAAITHLRSFIRRNASADIAKTLTLREELRRARLTLAKLDSD